MKCYLAGTTVATPYEKIALLFKQGHKLHSFMHSKPGGFEKDWFEMNKQNKVELMLDSGAHSLYTEHMIKTKHAFGYDWSDTDKFWNYVDEYASFVKEHEDFIDCYVNVDVIFNPKQSWKVLKYMEKKHSLSPMPVIHYGTDLKWLERHIKSGYVHIGLGGLGQEVNKSQYTAWADKAFNIVCDQPSRMPLVKVHGFAMTSLELMLRYPWWSVDSTSWVVTGRMGSIYIPRYANGQWIYDKNSWKVAVSNRSPSTKEANKHIETFPPTTKNIFLYYIHSKGYKMGKSTFKTELQNYQLKEGERWGEKKPEDKFAKRQVEIIEEEGISNKYQLRDEMNIVYFLDLEKSMPEWPWAFKRKSGTGFGL